MTDILMERRGDAVVVSLRRPEMRNALHAVMFDAIAAVPDVLPAGGALIAALADDNAARGARGRRCRQRPAAAELHRALGDEQTVLGRR